MTIPPVKKNQIFAAGRETGQGVDKTDSRAHVMGVVYMADERKPEVKKITRSKPYKEIEKDLRDQLEANGTYGKFFEDMIADYMAMYVTKTLLIADIQKRELSWNTTTAAVSPVIRKMKQWTCLIRQTRKC